MVFYECVIATKHTAHFDTLSSIMKKLCHIIVTKNNGIVRSIQNHGVRTFPTRMKARVADYTTGQRYYEQGRMISIYYDTNPDTNYELNVALARDDIVLRSNTTKVRSILDYATLQPKSKPTVGKIVDPSNQIKSILRDHNNRT